MNASPPAFVNAADSTGAVFPRSNEEVGEEVDPVTASERAPLLLFGVGSLAVGGVLYGIEATSSNRGNMQVLGKSSDVNFAILMAGLSAAGAGWAFFHYGHTRDTGVSGTAAVIPEASGRNRYAAVLSLRFQILGG